MMPEHDKERRAIARDLSYIRFAVERAEKAMQSGMASNDEVYRAVQDIATALERLRTVKDNSTDLLDQLDRLADEKYINR